MSDAKNAVWPVMVTPFTAAGAIDYDVLKALVEWYEERGAGGLFTTCAMSEMTAMSLKERAALPAAVKKAAKIPVAASGHISYSFDDQVEEIKAVEASGADVAVLLTNRIALPGAATEAWKDNLCKLMAVLDGKTKLGLYEWPGTPGVWRVTDDELAFAAGTGRFVFMKDTCCNIDTLYRRAAIAAKSGMRLYNANAASYLASLRFGYSGFCGIMANYHPEIYAWLAGHFDKNAETADMADLVQSFLTVASFGEGRVSPVSAKYHISSTGAPINIISRLRDYRELSGLGRYETEQMALLADWVKSLIGININKSNGAWQSMLRIAQYRDWGSYTKKEQTYMNNMQIISSDNEKKAYNLSEPIQI